jgi:long-chain fatty acid transport protein
MRMRPVAITAAVVLSVLVEVAPALAQGYGLYEQGACQMGRAGAGVAAPCDDGSAMFFNPAGLALETGAVASGGVTGIAPRGTFTNRTTGLVSALRDRTFPAPTVYAAVPVGRRFVAGAGLFAPYGLTSDWPSSSEGRFLGYYSSIRSIYVQPTIAYRATDRILIGAGVDITHASVDLRRRVDLSAQPITGTPLTFAALGVPAGTDFADVDLSGSGTHAGAHVGVLVKATRTVSFGARYLSRQHVSIENGQLTVEQIPTTLRLPVPLPGIPAGTPLDALVAPSFAAGGRLGNQTATTTLPLPDQFVAGVAVQATERLKVLGDYQFVHWKLFDTVTIANAVAPATVLVENYRDTHGVRIGAEYALARAILRGGFDAHTAGAPDQSVTPLLPEAPRREFAAGAGVPFPGGRIDVFYMYVDQEDRPGRTTDGGLAVPTASVNNGVYEYRAHLIGASVVVKF